MVRFALVRLGGLVGELLPHKRPLMVFVLAMRMMIMVVFMRRRIMMIMVVFMMTIRKMIIHYTIYVIDCDACFNQSQSQQK